MIRTTAIAAVATAAFALSAWAQDKDDHRHTKLEAPYLEIEAGFQLRFDWAFASDDPGNRITRLFIDHGETVIGLHLTDWLALKTHVSAEGLRPPIPGRNAWFRGFGVFLEEIYVDLDFKDVGFFAGKFNPTFGIAHDEHKIRGIGSVEFAEDYKLAEMIGFGFSLRPDLTKWGLGRHNITAQLFFADTTFLNHSIITTPKATDQFVSRASDTRFGDGGLANTNRFDNVSITLAGRDISILPDLGYQFGFRLLRASPVSLAAGTQTTDETAYSAALDYQFKVESLLPGGTTITPIVEWAHIRNVGGNPGIRNYYTAAVSFETGPWELWLVGVLRNTSHVVATPDVRDRLLTVSLDYAVNDWLKLGAGYRYERASGINTHAVGLRLAVDTHFDVPLR